MSFNILRVFMVLRVTLFYFPAIRRYEHPQYLQWPILIYAALILLIRWRMRQGFKRGELVTSGPYKYFAHPTYCLYILVDVCFMSFMVQPSMWNTLTSLVFVGSTLFTAYFEEKNLINVYKDKARWHLGRTLSVNVFLR
jgi:protein-S-isoprenylcysteine O-methyltransferase Ste14